MAEGESKSGGEPPRPMEDVPLRAPKWLPRPIDPELERRVRSNAGEVRVAAQAIVTQLLARDPENVLVAVLAAMKLSAFQSAQWTVDQLHAAGAKVACAAGCFACCCQNVAATIPEAALIALRLSDPEDPRRAKVLAAADEDMRLDAEARRRLGRPCPLLVDGRCSVYDERPLMCRSVLSSNAPGCDRALKVRRETGEDGINDYFLAAQFFICGDGAGLQGACKDLGLQHEAFDLVQLVAAMLRNPDLPARWAAGQRVFGTEAAAPERTPSSSAPSSELG